MFKTFPPQPDKVHKSSNIKPLRRFCGPKIKKLSQELLSAGVCIGKVRVGFGVEVWGSSEHGDFGLCFRCMFVCSFKCFHNQKTGEYSNEKKIYWVMRRIWWCINMIVFCFWGITNLYFSWEYILCCLKRKTKSYFMIWNGWVRICTTCRLIKKGFVKSWFDEPLKV